ncbi:hypothetical protein CDD83_1022 [Cordyceps sp. RAO-2017]|nr:hypothetical protein CDD83_1022 [Cordyceps sp. RAO-2017]
MKSLRHELWGGLCRESQLKYAQDYTGFVFSHLPPSLRRLHLSQEFKRMLHARGDRLTWWSKSMSFLAGFVRASRQLEHLTVYDIVDAAHFLGNHTLRSVRQHDHKWTNLQTLCLRSSRMRPDRRGDVDALLQRAAVAALSMPKLCRMELWGCEDGKGCHFCYRVSDGRRQHRLTWRSNWDEDLRFSRPTERLWSRVARQQYVFADLDVRYMPIPVRRLENERMRLVILHGWSSPPDVLGALSIYQLVVEDRNCLRL